jgi:hypothetical protein
LEGRILCYRAAEGCAHLSSLAQKEIRRGKSVPRSRGLKMGPIGAKSELEKGRELGKTEVAEPVISKSGRRADRRDNCPIVPSIQLNSRKWRPLSLPTLAPLIYRTIFATPSSRLACVDHLLSGSHWRWRLARQNKQLSRQLPEGVIFPRAVRHNLERRANKGTGDPTPTMVRLPSSHSLSLSLTLSRARARSLQPRPALLPRKKCARP